MTRRIISALLVICMAITLLPVTALADEVQEAPVSEAVQETPVKEAPEEKPPVEETPTDKKPAEKTTEVKTPAEGTPAEGTSAEGTPAEGTPVQEDPENKTEEQNIALDPVNKAEAPVNLPAENEEDEEENKEPKKYSLEVTSDIPSGKGVTGGGMYAEGDSVTIYAPMEVTLKNNTAKFEYWNYNGKNPNNEITFEMPAENLKLMAHYKMDKDDSGEGEDTEITVTVKHYLQTEGDQYVLHASYDNLCAEGSMSITFSPEHYEGYTLNAEKSKPECNIAAGEREAWFYYDKVAEQETFSVTYTDGVNGEAFSDQVYPNCMPNSHTPGYKGTPTRAGYVFNGWNPEKAQYVTEDAVYTATWVLAEQETFSVTYRDGVDGEAFDDQVYPNCMPNSRTPGYKGTPARAGYVFNGWNPEKAQYVTEDAVYTATWVLAEQETFSVTYTDGVGGAAFDDQVYPNCMPNSRTPGYKGTPTREGYEFTGWTPEKAQYVTEDAVYTATWVEKKQETFTVTYKDGVGGAAFDDQVYVNCMPNSRTPGYKGTPTREGYEFIGWTPEKAQYVTEDAVYTATWVEKEQETFNVTYKDGVGGAAFDDQVYVNCMPNSRTPGYKGTPTREGYEFTGWTPEKAQYVTEDAVYTATWVEKKQETFTVTYKDGVGGKAFADQVHPNCMPNSRTPGYKGTPTRAGYVFAGWTPEKAQYVTEDAVYTATWVKEEQETFTVTYNDGVSGKKIFADQVYDGLHKGDETPEFKGKPIRKGYTFKGWSPEVEEFVSGNAVYKAKWERDDDHGHWYDKWGDNPKTGDTIMFAVAVMVLSAGALMTLAVVNKTSKCRKEKRSK